MSSPESSKVSAAEQIAATELAVEARRHRRTALIALKGELDVASVTQVTDVLEGLQPHPDGLRHIVLDLRCLTFMDSTGLHTLLGQSEYARVNCHNLAVVRGSAAIQRLLELTRVDQALVLFDDHG